MLENLQACSLLFQNLDVRCQYYYMAYRVEFARHINSPFEKRKRHRRRVLLLLCLCKSITFESPTQPIFQKRLDQSFAIYICAQSSTSLGGFSYSPMYFKNTLFKLLWTLFFGIVTSHSHSIFDIFVPARVFSFNQFMTIQLNLDIKNILAV